MTSNKKSDRTSSSREAQFLLETQQRQPARHDKARHVMAGGGNVDRSKPDGEIIVSPPLRDALESDD